MKMLKKTYKCDENTCGIETRCKYVEKHGNAWESIETRGNGNALDTIFSNDYASQLNVSYR